MTDRLEAMRLAFDLAPVGLAVTRHREIETCNGEFAAIFGYGPADLTGKSLSRLYPSAEEYRRIGEIGEAEMRETGRYGDTRIMRRRDGGHFWCRVEGRSLTPGDPFARAVWCMTDISESRPLVQLTRRERQVAMLLTEGRTSKDIARLLAISPRTVEAHRAKLNEKMGTKNTAECVARLSGLPEIGTGG